MSAITGQLANEPGKSCCCAWNGEGDDMELDQHTRHPQQEVGAFMFHDHSLAEQITHGSIFSSELMGLRDKAHP